MTALLQPDELIEDLQRALRERHPRVHPVRQLLLSGRLTREQLQAWAMNQFHEFRNIHRFFGIRYQKCPVPELRRMLLENMVEEEGEDLFGGKYPSHRELWVRFAEGLGIARDDILSYEPLPAVRAALEMYVSLVQQSHWAVAIGTGLVFEGGGPQRMREEREALERHYPWIPRESLDFFRAHEYHDEGHGRMVIDVIRRYCMEPHLQHEMREAVRQRADIMWLQNDAIYNAFVRPSLAQEVIREIEDGVR
ncbi:MAG TPA: iron-containing redox enzyme family protein [candidate division Zixibacteria bacterium]|nr:iron-containing redox enzyme family protein [candidate division Zixibacteria bacterium]